MTTEKVAFSQPYAWLPGAPVPSVGESSEGSSPGLYLWTVGSPAGHLVYYVGETARTLAGRVEEHLYEQLSGRYRFYEPAAFLRGEKTLLWRGLYGRRAKPNVAEFVDDLPSLAGALAQFIRNMRFLVARTGCSDRLRRRIEAALASHFEKQPGIVGAFQDAGIHYEPRLPDEPVLSVEFTWRQRPLGAPERLDV